MEKIIKKSLVEYITGARKELVLIGHPLSVAIVYEAAQASRKLYVALQEGDIDSVKSAIELKRSAVDRYERETGDSWGL